MPPIEISELTVLKGKGGCKVAADDVCVVLYAVVSEFVPSVDDFV